MNALRNLLSRLRCQSVLGITLTIVLSTMFALSFTFLLPASSRANTPVTGAAFTTTNTNVDGTGHCKNGNETVNCNIYDGKQYVWLNGGPSVAYVGNGSYFFAVLDPGGQKPGPNDGDSKNLSSSFDTHDDRTFSVSDGTVNYSGSHDFDSNKIRLIPYDDTSNPGGVYILAICSLANGYPVDPSSCKYDAFKIQQGEVQPGKPLTITKDANGSDTNTFTWQIQKSVDQTKVVDSGGSATFNYTVKATHDSGTISAVKVTGTIRVFNPNVVSDTDNTTVAVTIDGVTDQLSDGTNCTVTNGGSQTLTQFETDFAYTCDLSALPQGQLDNTASVSWSQQLLDNGALLATGPANFTFSNIAFTENKVDDCVDVTDTLGGTLGKVCSTDPSPTSFTYAHKVTGTPGTCVNQDNTATFKTNTTGATGSDSQSVQMCTPENLQVTKNATPGFTRTYNWDIKKNVDKTLVEQIGGGTATVTYTVTVTQTGYTDNGWNAKGKITLTNPNDFFNFTGVTVTDAVDNGGSCTVTSGTDVTVLAGQTVDLNYTCTYSSQPAYNAVATNTATATWDSTSVKTPDSSASGKASLTFNDGSSGNPNEVNKCVTVTDSFAGTLGTDCVGTDPAAKGFTYQRTFTVPTFNCVAYPNMATITETGQTANASVEVCGPAKTGALTMGFWQNKNGQGIISGGTSTGSVCNSGTWLRQYAPFQDLSATATCSQVATYVYNIVKAANASGSSMNAMLKAQMLATALDVYFSDPALGGNKISTPAPIGGVKIDLTMICHMIDGSGGTATCSGTFENVSSAFGSATSMKVSDMLTYAAGQSNAGGSSWYGNVKSTQQLAKDAFDAINNQVAFAP